MLNGLSASGWHLCSITMRMMFDGYIGRTASLGSPGVNELRWLAPLRPGDDLTLDVEVVEARVSRSRPATGIVTFKALVRNAAGQPLCEMVVADHRDAARRRSSGAGRLMRFFEDIEVGQRREVGSFTFTAERHQALRRAIRSAALSSRRRGRAQIAVRRARRVGLACRLGLHEADGGRRPAPGAWRPPRVARRSRSGDRRRVFANCAGSSRCWRATPSASPARSNRCATSESRPEWGILQARNTGTNQRGELVFSFLATAFVPRRNAGPPDLALIGAAGTIFPLTHFEPCPGH